MRGDARAIAPELGYEAEAAQLHYLIGSLLDAGQTFDPERIRLFENLFTALRERMSESRPVSPGYSMGNPTLAFFEAYFSNFIEGTEFTVDEAAEIVFDGVIPAERPADAHDVLGTFRVVSDVVNLRRLPTDVPGFVDLLRRRHAMVMEARPDKTPGAFKSQENRAGATVFVAPDLVDGTLERGFDFLQALDDPFQRAVFMMVLVSEVHPFADGNGRLARIMMNAELVARDQQRIIIPTAYRTDYLGALKAFSHNGLTEPLIRMLDAAQRYTNGIDWSTVDTARAALSATNAFAEGAEEKLILN